MIQLRSLLFNTAFYVWTIFSVLICVPLLVLPRLGIVRAQTLWARGVNFLLRTIAGIHVEIRGEENLPRGACLIAAKHQSAWDTLIFHIVLDDPAIVMKRELLWIPIYGWYSLRTNMIAVDRKAGTRALRSMLQQAKARIAEDRPVLIFPQGTRVAPDARTADVPYQAGVAALYSELNVTTVPVAVNSGLFWPRRQFLRRPGTIVLEFLPVLPPGLKRRDFMAALEQRIEPATARLVAEGRAAAK